MEQANRFAGRQAVQERLFACLGGGDPSGVECLRVDPFPAPDLGFYGFGSFLAR